MDKTKYILSLLGMVVMLVVLSTAVAAVEDELLQTGVVKSLNSMTKTVVIDVRSSSCRGTRTFTVAEPEAFEVLINKTIDFVINSNVCKPGEVYAIESLFVQEVNGK